MNVFLILCLLFIGLFFSSSCGQLTSLQTAKVVGKGQMTIGAAAMGYGVDDSISGNEIGTGVFPHVEVFGRYGLSDNFDMGLKLSSAANLLLDGKFQFLGDGDSPFAMAIGAGLEYQFNGVDNNNEFVYRVHVPVYLSFHPSEEFAVYATPRYMVQFADDNYNFPGGSFGFSYDFNSRLIGMLEGSLYKPFSADNNNDNTSLFLFGIACKYRLNR